MSNRLNHYIQEKNMLLNLLFLEIKQMWFWWLLLEKLPIHHIFEFDCPCFYNIKASLIVCCLPLSFCVSIFAFKYFCNELLVCHITYCMYSFRNVRTLFLHKEYFKSFIAFILFKYSTHFCQELQCIYFEEKEYRGTRQILAIIK